MTNIDELASRYNSIAVHLARRLRLTDREMGLTPARAAALSVLVFGGPRTLSALAGAEGVTAPTMSRIVRGMESDGLVTRSPHATDGRAAMLEATAKGRRLMEQGRQRRVEQLARRLRRLTEAELGTLEAAAGILEALERVED